MNQKDREQMTNFKTQVDELNQKQVSLNKKVDRILLVLQDDNYSSSTGLISEFNELRDATRDLQKQMVQMMYINRSIKRVFWWLMGIFGSVLAFLINNFFKD
tara:strand:+ start:257 stop:562 length:306 start_codon:yes stop_codon:yes gene_type:complete